MPRRSTTRSTRSACAPARQRANKLADAYDLDGVPAIGVNGKYLTAPSLAGSNEAALRVVDELIARERKGA